MRLINIGLMLPMGNDPTSFYRGLGPFCELEKKDHRLCIKYLPPQGTDWSQLKTIDILVLQRPSQPDHVNTVLLAKDMKIPVWVDMDDYNVNVPEENPMYYQYASDEIKGCVVRLARFADVLTVPTEYLKEKLGIYNRNCLVIPNAFDDQFLHYRNAVPSTPREKRITWRGTPTHSDNLRSVKDQVIKLSEKYREWKFLFFGADFREITRYVKNREIWGTVPSTPITMLKLIEAHSTLMYYPIALDVEHSMARSFVSWLEASVAGTPLLAPKVKEFERPGIINYESPQDFEDKVDAVIRGDFDLDKLNSESWQHIMENFLLSKVNIQRLELINQLFSRVR